MGKRSESEVGGRPRRPEQTPNTTMELSDSELYPMSMARRPPASHPAPGGARGKARRARTPGGDVSMWQGMVVRSEDFAPTRPRRKRPWIWIALVGAIGTFIAVYAVIASSDAGSSAGAATPPAGTAAAGAGSPSTKTDATKPAAAVAAATKTDSPTDASVEVDAISSAAPIYKAAKKSGTKKKTTKKKRVTKRSSKKRRR